MADLLPPDGSWADLLTRKERRALSEKLGRAAKSSFWARTASYHPERGRWDDANARTVERHMRTSAEMQDLHLDVTERAAVPAKAAS
jgi:hypothetical protein